MLPKGSSMRFLLGGLCALSLAAWMSNQPVGAATSCENLAALKLPNTTITLAKAVEPGPLAVSETGNGQPMNITRAFCRVAATLKPSADSDIKIEVWMPAANWNGKLQAVGNGAFSGAVAYPAMATALARGYAASSTDTGHAGGSASFAMGHPEKVIDFGWRSVHEMTVVSKDIIAAYYDGRPKLSYWNGCSAGGRQAMKEAQRFPADFDGIIAGAPGLDWTGRAAQAVRVAQVLEKDEAARLPQTKAIALHAAVLSSCDAVDGLKDGLIANPQRCSFDPAVLQCKGADEPSCLTPAQVTTAKMMYSAQVSTRSKRETAGVLPGSELGWTDLGWTGSARATGLDQFRYLVFKDASWTIAKYRPGTDLAAADDADENTLNALDTNLKPFIDRGGKLIQYHGWSDPQISPGNSVAYFDRVSQTLKSSNLRDGYRLFMAPGMDHCRGGEGPNVFDPVIALEQWVEQKKAPDQIVASHLTNGSVDRTRPLCPYPQIATYKGSGSLDDAASFSCK